MRKVTTTQLPLTRLYAINCFTVWH